MPSACDRQRDLMTKWFGDIDTRGPMQFLAARGWTEKGGMYSKPTSYHNPSYIELECILFLRNEWDFGFHQPLYQPSISGEF